MSGGALIDEELGIEEATSSSPAVPAAPKLVDADLGIEEASASSGAAPAAPRPNVSRMESFARGAQNTAGFGFDDEGSGLASKMFGEAPRTVGRGIDAPRDQRTDYEVGRDRAREEHRQAQEANPGTYFAGQVVGGAPASAVPITRLGAGGAQLLPRLASAAVNAAPLGAAYAAGQSEAKTPLGVTFDTLEGGLTSAVAAPVVSETVRKVVNVPQAVRKYVQGRTKGQEEKLVSQYGPEGLQTARAVGDASEYSGVQPGKPLPKTASAQLRDQLKRANDPEALSQQAAELERQVARVRSASRAYREPIERAGSPERVQELSRSITDRVSRIAKAADDIKWEEDISQKGKLATKLMARDLVDPERVAESADVQVDGIGSRLAELSTYVEPGTPDAGIVRKLAREVKEYRLKPITGAEGEGVTPYQHAGEKFLRVDQLKREFQKALSGARSRRDSPILEELQALEKQLRTNLENEAVWGSGVSQLQRARNEAWRTRLLLESQDNNPRRLLLTDASGKASQDEYRLLLEGDQASLHGIVKDAAEYTNEPRARQLVEWADREANLLQTLVDHIDPDPVLKRQAAASRRAANELRSLLEQRKGEAQAFTALPKDDAPALEGLHGMLRDVLEHPTDAKVAQLRAWADREIKALSSSPATKPQADEARQALQAMEGLIEQRRQDAIAARHFAKLSPRVDAVSPTVGQRIGEGARQLPLVGKPMQELISLVPGAGTPKAPSLVERAKLLMHLEDVLRVDPTNRPALETLKRLAAEDARRTRILSQPAPRAASSLPSRAAVPATAWAAGGLMSDKQ